MFDRTTKACGLEEQLFELVTNQMTENDDQDPLSIIEKTIKIIVEDFILIDYGDE
jgi:hypothetical protein